MNNHYSKLLVAVFLLIIGQKTIAADPKTLPSAVGKLQERKKLMKMREGYIRPRLQEKTAGAFTQKKAVHHDSTPKLSVHNRATYSESAFPVQSIGLNFTAATPSNTVSWLEPLQNQNGWVGPKQYILMSYGAIRSFDKFTGQPDGVLNIDASNFFGVYANDVRINYSRYADRWFMSCEIRVPYPNGLIIAWSDSGVITPGTVWTIHTFTSEELAPQNNPADGPALTDYNQLATDANAVYISVDTFDAITGVFLGTSTVVMPNSSFVSGNAFNYTIFPAILPGPNPTTFGPYTPPADNFDPQPEYGYLVHASSNQITGYPSGDTYNQLYLYRIINPGSSNPTLSAEIPLAVPDYSDAVNAPHKGNLYTVLLGGVNAGFLQTTDCLLTAPHVRNKQLYVCHNIQVDSTGTGTPNGDRVGVRWYQFDLTGDPTGQGRGIETATTVPWLVQVGTLYDSSASNPLFYYIPAIMTNKNGDLVIEGTVSGANAYTNVFYAGRKAMDHLGTLRDPVLITNNTSNPFNNGPLNNPANVNIGQRWGDLSSLAPDPCNDLDIWGTGQWAAIKNGWGIQVTQLKPTH